MDDKTKKAMNALGVLIKTPHIREYLTHKDPKALQQAEEAFNAFTEAEYRTYPDAGPSWTEEVSSQNTRRVDRTGQSPQSIRGEQNMSWKSARNKPRPPMLQALEWVINCNGVATDDSLRYSFTHNRRVDGKQNVAIALADGTRGLRLDSREDHPESWDICEVECLYTHRGGSLTQPVLKGIRNDVAADTADQLQYKNEER